MIVSKSLYYCTIDATYAHEYNKNLTFFLYKIIDHKSQQYFHITFLPTSTCGYGISDQISNC